MSARQRTWVWMKECTVGGACTPSSSSIEMCWEGSAASGSMGCTYPHRRHLFLPKHRQDGQNQLGNISSSRREPKKFGRDSSHPPKLFTGALFRAGTGAAMEHKVLGWDDRTTEHIIGRQLPAPQDVHHPELPQVGSEDYLRAPTDQLITFHPAAVWPVILQRLVSLRQTEGHFISCIWPWIVKDLNLKYWIEINSTSIDLSVWALWLEFAVGFTCFIFECQILMWFHRCMTCSSGVSWAVQCTEIALLLHRFKWSPYGLGHVVKYMGYYQERFVLIVPTAFSLSSDSWDGDETKVPVGSSFGGLPIVAS